MNNSIKQVIKREYLTRVKSKTFLLTTLLAPIGMVLLFGVLGFLLTRGSDDLKNIAVINQAGLNINDINKKRNINFDYTYYDVDQALRAYKDKKLSGVLVLPEIDINNKNYDIIYHSDDQLAIDESESIRSLYRKQIRNHKITTLGLDADQLKLIETDISLNPKTVLDKEKEISSITSVVTSGLGGVVGYALFFIIIIYGSQVMRSVTEEKINRIVEVLISTIRPFDLMMGKVIGVGLVGLTQIFIWFVLIFLLSSIGMVIFGESIMGSMTPDIAQGMPEIQEVAEGEKEQITLVIKEIMSINWLKIIPLYLFYFLVGYFTYAALFAAIGSAVGDDIQEAQSLTMIATMPLMVSVYIGFSAVTSPNSSLSVWSSILPFTAPVVMPVRLPTDPPLWQIGLSIVVSIITVFILIWLAGRIYRVGILMYGKKSSVKELFKWIMYK